MAGAKGVTESNYCYKQPDVSFPAQYIELKNVEYRDGIKARKQDRDH